MGQSSEYRASVWTMGESIVQDVREAYKKMEKGRAAGPSKLCTEMLGEINCLNVVC